MANDFSADANCRALWNLESGALTTDSKSTNTLTNVGVDEDLVKFKQGSCSGRFIRANADRMYRTDANLSAGFPLKSGAADKSFSFAFWVYFDAIDLTQYILCKTGSVPDRCLIVMFDTTEKMNILISADGTNWNYYIHATALVAGRWYHVGITYDGNNDDSYRIRIWDDTAGAIVGVDKTGIASDICIAAGNLYLGYSSTVLTLGGNLDEVVVFNDVLSVAEIDAIRAGTFGGGAPSQTVLDYERKTRGVNRGVCRGAA